MSEANIGLFTALHLTPLVSFHTHAIHPILHSLCPVKTTSLQHVDFGCLRVNRRMCFFVGWEDSPPPEAK